MLDGASTSVIGMIDQVYAAALDQTKWPDLLSAISGQFRDASTLLWHTDRNDSRFNLHTSHGYEPSTLLAYEQHFYALNPWIPKKLLIPAGRLHRTETLYPEDELIKTEFYADFLRPLDLFKGFGVSLFNDRRFGFLSILRSKRAGPPSDDELRRLELLTPHLQRAIQLHERLRLPLHYTEPALAVLDRLTRGVIFVGQDKRSGYANPAASLILSEADGLSLDRGGHCRTASASEQASLDRLHRWGGRRTNAAGAGRRLARERRRDDASRRPSGRRPYGLVVAPMPSPQFGLAADRDRRRHSHHRPGIGDGASSAISCAFSIDCPTRKPNWRSGSRPGRDWKSRQATSESPIRPRVPT